MILGIDAHGYEYWFQYGTHRKLCCWVWPWGGVLSL